MPGTLSAVGLIGCATALTFGLATVGSAAVFSQRLAAGADAAALAAADAASGAVPGVPCELAARLATVSGGVIDGCEIDGVTATVSISGRFGLVTATASARAGPPG
ncbi:Rv3654c family TadE-like protein [Microbacterium deminutum]